MCKFWLENSPRSCCRCREKHFYFKMLVTFEPNVAQRSVASQNDHKSKACLPEASNTAFTMYRRLKRRLRRLYEAPFLAPFFGASKLYPPSHPQKMTKGNFGAQGNLHFHELLQSLLIRHWINTSFHLGWFLLQTHGDITSILSTLQVL